MSKLKPCPFCGESPTVEYVQHSVGNTAVIICVDCGVEMRKYDSSAKCAQDAYEYVAEYWNERV